MESQGFSEAGVSVSEIFEDAVLLALKMVAAGTMRQGKQATS